MLELARAVTPSFQKALVLSATIESPSEYMARKFGEGARVVP
jgi:hypothetical protein